MRGIIVVVFDDPTTDINTETIEAAEKVRQATGGTKRVQAVTGQVADDVLDVISLHAMPEGRG